MQRVNAAVIVLGSREAYDATTPERVCLGSCKSSFL